MKCKVCGKRFTPTVERVYQASEEVTIFSALTTAPRVYDVMDCPQCGCQQLLKVRMPRFNVGSEVDEDEENHCK